MNSNNLMKYTIFFLLTFVILRYIPEFKLDESEQVSLTALISCMYIILDTLYPSLVIDGSKINKQTTKSKKK